MLFYLHSIWVSVVVRMHRILKYSTKSQFFQRAYHSFLAPQQLQYIPYIYVYVWHTCSQCSSMVGPPFFSRARDGICRECVFFVFFLSLFSLCRGGIIVLRVHWICRWYIVAISRWYEFLCFMFMWITRVHQSWSEKRTQESVAGLRRWMSWSEMGKAACKWRKKWHREIHRETSKQIRYAGEKFKSWLKSNVVDVFFSFLWNAEHRYVISHRLQSKMGSFVRKEFFT